MKKLFALVLSCACVFCHAQDVSTLIPKIKDAIFTVYAEDENHTIFGSGSGFFISSSGIGITNFHVLQGATFGHIKDTKGHEYKIDYVLDYNPQHDLVKFKVSNVNQQTFKSLTVKTTLPQQGESIISYSNPLGQFENTVSTGIVSAIRDYTDYGTVLQITAPISHGSSGSPIVNKLGEVVGIATFGHKEGQSLNFAVSALQLSKLNQNLHLSIDDMQKTPLETKRVRQAQVLELQGNYAAAIELLNQEVNSEPLNHLAYYYRGLFKCRANACDDGMYDLMLACILDSTEYIYFEKAANFAKNQAIMISERGDTIPQKLFETTTSLYDRCFAIDPYRPDAYAGLGYFLFHVARQNQDEELHNLAIELLNYAVDLYPSAEYYCQLAQIYDYRRMAGEALLCCDAALNAHDIKTLGLQWRVYLIRGGVRCFHLDQFAEGILDLTMAEALAPDGHYKADVNGGLGVAYSYKARKTNSRVDIHKAAQYFNRAVDLETMPEYLPVYYKKMQELLIIDKMIK